MTRLAALALAVLVAAGPARAQDGLLTGTLKTIAERGVFRIGVRESSIPFSFTNKAGQPVGFSVDLCEGIAADVAEALNRDLLEPDAPAWRTGLRVATVPVASDARIAKVLSGEIDVECGSTTANAERARQVAFSPVFFLAGTKLMVPADAAITSYRDLAGKIVAVAAGTTNGDVLRALARRVAFIVTDAPNLPAAFDLLARGQAAAFASDDVLLAGMLASRPDGRRFRIVGDYLSFEPYGIMFRRDDAAFADLVTRSFARMAADGTLRGRYNRWFTDTLPNGERLDLPMSAQLSEMYRALGEPD